MRELPRAFQTICSPTGSPSGVNPAGTEMAGTPRVVIEVAGGHPVEIGVLAYARYFVRPQLIRVERCDLTDWDDQHVIGVEEGIRGSLQPRSAQRESCRASRPVLARPSRKLPRQVGLGRFRRCVASLGHPSQRAQPDGGAASERGGRAVEVGTSWFAACPLRREPADRGFQRGQHLRVHRDSIAESGCPRDPKPPQVGGCTVASGAGSSVSDIGSARWAPAITDNSNATSPTVRPPWRQPPPSTRLPRGRCPVRQTSR